MDDAIEIARGDASFDAVVDAANPDVADVAIDVVRDVVVDGPRCSRDDECTDGVACTVDRCTGGVCVITPDDARCPTSFACEPAVGCEARAWATTGTEIYDVRLPSGRTQRVAAIEGADYYYDLALAPNGRVYASGSDLVELVPQKDTWRVGAELTGSSFLSALDVSPDGTIYAGAGQALLRYDPAAGLTPVGRYPAGHRASGDLAFVGGVLYGTAFQSPFVSTGGDALVVFDLVAGTSRIIGRTGFTSVLGLAGSGGRLFGFTGFGEIIEISLVTGVGTRIAKPLASQAGFLGATAR